MKKQPYYRGLIKLPFEESLTATTKNALCFMVANDPYDTTESNCRQVWIPRSLVKTLTPNRLGTAEIQIPLWFLKQEGVDGELIKETYEYPGEPDVVWI